MTAFSFFYTNVLALPSEVMIDEQDVKNCTRLNPNKRMSSIWEIVIYLKLFDDVCVKGINTLSLLFLNRSFSKPGSTLLRFQAIDSSGRAKRQIQFTFLFTVFRLFY